MSEEPAKDAKARMLRSGMKAEIHIHIHVYWSPTSLARPVCSPAPVPPLSRLGPLPVEIRAPVAVEPGEVVLLAAVALPRC